MSRPTANEHAPRKSAYPPQMSIFATNEQVHRKRAYSPQISIPTNGQPPLSQLRGVHLGDEPFGRGAVE